MLTALKAIIGFSPSEQTVWAGLSSVERTLKLSSLLVQTIEPRTLPNYLEQLSPEEYYPSYKEKKLFFELFHHATKGSRKKNIPSFKNKKNRVSDIVFRLLDIPLKMSEVKSTAEMMKHQTKTKFVSSLSPTEIPMSFFAVIDILCEIHNDSDSCEKRKEVIKHHTLSSYDIHSVKHILEKVVNTNFDLCKEYALMLEKFPLAYYLFIGEFTFLQHLLMNNEKSGAYLKASPLPYFTLKRDGDLMLCDTQLANYVDIHSDFYRSVVETWPSLPSNCFTDQEGAVEVNDLYRLYALNSDALYKEHRKKYYVQRVNLDSMTDDETQLLVQYIPNAIRLANTFDLPLRKLSYEFFNHRSSPNMNFWNPITGALTPFIHLWGSKESLHINPNEMAAAYHSHISAPSAQVPPLAFQYWTNINFDQISLSTAYMYNPTDNLRVMVENQMHFERIKTIHSWQLLPFTSAIQGYSAPVADYFFGKHPIKESDFKRVMQFAPFLVYESITRTADSHTLPHFDRVFRHISFRILNTLLNEPRFISKKHRAKKYEHTLFSLLVTLLPIDQRRRDLNHRFDMALADKEKNRSGEPANHFFAYSLASKAPGLLALYTKDMPPYHTTVLKVALLRNVERQAGETSRGFYSSAVTEKERAKSCYKTILSSFYKSRTNEFEVFWTIFESDYVFTAEQFEELERERLCLRDPTEMFGEEEDSEEEYQGIFGDLE